MELVITPVPSAEERQAIAAALAALDSSAQPRESAWLHAARLDAIAEDDADA